MSEDHVISVKNLTIVGKDRGISPSMKLQVVFWVQDFSVQQYVESNQPNADPMESWKYSRSSVLVASGCSLMYYRDIFLTDF